MTPKMLLIAVLFSSLSVSIIATMQVVEVASANPFPTYPVISIESPTNKTYTANLLLLNVTLVTQWDGLYFTSERRLVSYCIDGKESIQVTQAGYKFDSERKASMWYGSAVLSNLTEGTHNLRVNAEYAYDNGKQVFVSNSNVSFTIDPNYSPSPSPLPDSSADSWTSKAPMNVARSVLGVAAVNGKIYAIGGSTATGFAPSIPPSAAYGDINLGGFVSTNEQYDPILNTWTYKASMPTPRMALATAVYNNKIYCIGGRSVAGVLNGGYTAINEVYDPATDKWETKAAMPKAAGWLIANVVDSKIYVMDYSGANYIYDPIADSWSTGASVPFPAFDGYASAVLDRKIYVVGGNLNSVYDTETNNWSVATPPPSSQGGGAAGATSGAMAPKRVYVFGEIANLKQGEDPRFVRVYDPKADNWEYGVDSPTDRYNFGVAILNETFYVIGGHTYNFPGNFAPVAVNEQYTPIGYGKPDTTYPTPSPTPSPLPSQSPSSTPSNSPTPTLSPSPSIPEFPTWLVLPMLLIIATLVAGAVKKKAVIKFCRVLSFSKNVLPRGSLLPSRFLIFSALKLPVFSKDLYVSLPSRC